MSNRSKPHFTSLRIIGIDIENIRNTNFRAYLETFCIANFTKRFRLPAVSAIDAAPHISRYRENGKYQPITVFLPKSKLCSLSSSHDRFIKGSSKIVGIDEVRIEEECKGIAPDGCQPDAMLRIGNSWIALEIRVSHKKKLADVSRFADAGIGVIEIFLKEMVGEEDLHNALKCRISGLSMNRHESDGKDKFFGREWLYSPVMRADLLGNWHLVRRGRQNTKNAPMIVFSAAFGTLGINPGKPSDNRQAISNADEFVQRMKEEYDKEQARKARLKEISLDSPKHSPTALEQQREAMIDARISEFMDTSVSTVQKTKKQNFFDRPLLLLRKALRR